MNEPGGVIDVLGQAAAWRARGDRVALATVIETWGSSPQPVGSRLAVSAGGEIAGSVSGGCVENAVAAAALESFASGPRVIRFGVTDARAWEVGLPCGGSLEVFVEPLA